MESRPQPLEEKITHIRLLLAEKMKVIYREHSVDPVEQEKVIDAILTGKKIGVDTWAGDALVNIPKLRAYSVEERELIVGSILDRE